MRRGWSTDRLWNLVNWEDVTKHFDAARAAGTPIIVDPDDGCRRRARRPQRAAARNVPSAATCRQHRGDFGDVEGGGRANGQRAILGRWMDRPA
ncbi:hypothetical protein Abr02nite_31380 [Paractinoplanes brasiliensis]|nr:hypothetical protein Abr02nite_31380 [Actinoplanes brasiliensis]